MLTKERCDECIGVRKHGIVWDSSGGISRDRMPTPDEAELFAYRLLDAVKRARENRDDNK